MTSCFTCGGRHCTVKWVATSVAVLVLSINLVQISMLKSPRYNTEHISCGKSKHMRQLICGDWRSRLWNCLPIPINTTAVFGQFKEKLTSSLFLRIPDKPSIRETLLRIQTLYKTGGWMLHLWNYGMVKTVDCLAYAQLNLTTVTKVRLQSYIRGWMDLEW